MTQVVCDYCEKAVYELTRFVGLDESPVSSAFKGINGFDSPEEGDSISCPSCSEPLFQSIVSALWNQVVDNA